MCRFPSYEEAMANSALPETTAFAAAGALLDPEQHLHHHQRGKPAQALVI